MVGTQSLETLKSYGITKPLSVAGPSAADLKRNLELEKFLIDEGLYESKEETMRREEVLGRIDQIVKHWVKELTRQRGYTDHMVEDANAVIFTFGSYRLGVHGPGADIDTLCVGPSYVNREEDFFIILRDILAEMEEVTELQPVTDAHVPVMKFKFQGISIDLLYASISLLVVPQDLDISSSSVLCDVDEQTVRSLNGCRVADQILKLVPNFEEIELKKQHWSSLFEQYMFFEAYKNYLQVDVLAVDAEDLLAWKGWVESRFRQLTLKIERDTNGMLMCHPQPNEYVDTSKQFRHCAFFMGLQRAEGVGGQECQQFDIRGTVDEFRQEVNMYMFWRPGMDVFVSHVRRRQLPPFVFPNGYKRPRQSRHQNQQSGEAGEPVESFSANAERHAKRKNDNEMMDTKPEKPEKRASLSPHSVDATSPDSSAITIGGTPPIGIVSGPTAECLVTSDLGCTTIPYVEAGAENFVSKSTEIIRFSQNVHNSGSEQILEGDYRALVQGCHDLAEPVGKDVRPDPSVVVACEGGQNEETGHGVGPESINDTDTKHRLDRKEDVDEVERESRSGEFADCVLRNGYCVRNLDHEGFLTAASLDSAVEHRNFQKWFVRRTSVRHCFISNPLLSGMGRPEDGARSESLQNALMRHQQQVELEVHSVSEVSQQL
ncbi:unnamed protein product [Thlaspi arvense]|uniref:polynucleotide adenylyltransferase n=1 Tax=Thlaspi arvense TaxID=13288 RepID=A0AAU9S980_THLAR|nr:unnamed protein product [Thlaspi arvense]